MKMKDYRRLARISLKSRKKSTRTTVRGISFGLILLMPLLFIVIAFYIDLNQEVNKESGIRAFDIPVIEEAIESTFPSTILDSDKTKLSEIEGVINNIEYQQYNFKSCEIFSSDSGEKAIYMSVKIGDREFLLDKMMANNSNDPNKDNRAYYTGITAYNLSSSSSIFLQSDYDVTNSSPMVGGETFSENSKGEIMLSSKFVELYNLEDVVGKYITISTLLNFNGNCTTNKYQCEHESLLTYNGFNVTVLKDYKIVGVFNGDIYNTAIRTKMEESYFWVTTDSINRENMANPIYIEGSPYYYYEKSPFEYTKDSTNGGYLFIPLGFGVDYNTNYSNTLYTSKYIIEFDSYSNANNAVNYVNSLIEKSTTSTEYTDVDTHYMVGTFSDYRLFYNIFTYICIAFAIFGGIVFFATLLNLYNTIHYSVQSRKNYIGMLRAIGMKGKEVLTLYFVEISEVFLRSYIWTIIFGGLICGGVWYAFDSIMDSEYAKLITIDLSLNPIYILVAFAILVVLNMIISIIFSLIATKKVSNAPILDVLQRE